MKIKKYEANTEQEAILKVKDDMGKDALVLSIKKIQPKGIFRFFKKPLVEVTAACEEENEKAEDNSVLPIPPSQNLEIPKSNEAPNAIDKTIEKLEKKIDGLKDILGNISDKMSDYENTNIKSEEGVYKNKILQVVYNNLISNEVMPEIANTLLDGLDRPEYTEGDNIDLAVKQVYDRIVRILGMPKPIQIGNPIKPIVIMGPTGVGKTTTIAKLSSCFMLKEHKTVGLITSDTYRIAAVEQLKTYADILGIEVEVVYSPDSVSEIVKKLEYNDIIFFDTAGCSYKNTKQIDELGMIIKNIGNCEKYLVLSMTTKFSDLQEIVKTYSNITDYNIIFTKYDETLKKGVVLNIAYLTGKSLSYITTGQNVPDDIEVLKPTEIAKVLLGSIDE